VVDVLRELVAQFGTYLVVGLDTEDIESVVRDNAATLRITDFGFEGGVGRPGWMT
jgi:hypothetical protein